MKCDNCNKQTATVHLTEIKNGKQIQKHLCEQCAAQNEGVPIKSHTPINELLTNFVMAHTGLQKELTAKGVRRAFVHRGGLRGEVVSGGRIRVGDPVRTLERPVGAE